MTMLSKPGYVVGSLLLTGAYTVHDLRAAVLAEGSAIFSIAEYIRDACLELVKCGAVVWTREDDWGNVPSRKPSAFDADSFMKDWNLVFPLNEISPGIPDKENRTLFLEGTERLETAIEEYEKLNHIE